MIEITEYASTDLPEWTAFVEKNRGANLFHDQRFLAYHPTERFRTCSLLFRADRRLIGVLPAALSDAGLVSPYGASVGGLVLADGLGTQEVGSVVTALQRFVSEKGWAGVELRLPPAIYQDPPEELQPFCLLKAGFRMGKASLCYLLALDPAEPTAAGEAFSKTKRYEVRSGLGRGLLPREVGPECLPAFLQLLKESSLKHQIAPTHDDAELEALFKLVPGRIRLFLCDHDGQEVAGVLLFMLNRRVATSFYICESTDPVKKRLAGPAVLLAHVSAVLAKEGLSYLDLGPSASESHLNEGVVFFKESLGARGFLRPTWSWSARAR